MEPSSKLGGTAEYHNAYHSVCRSMVHSNPGPSMSAHVVCMTAGDRVMPDREFVKEC